MSIIYSQERERGALIERLKDIAKIRLASKLFKQKIVINGQARLQK